MKPISAIDTQVSNSCVNAILTKGMGIPRHVVPRRLGPCLIRISLTGTNYLILVNATPSLSMDLSPNDGLIVETPQQEELWL
jgi:hypothetical protein